MKTKFDEDFDCPTELDWCTFTLDIKDKSRSTQKVNDFLLTYHTEYMVKLHKNLIAIILNSKLPFYKQHLYLKRICDYAKYNMEKLTEKVIATEKSSNTVAEFYKEFMNIYKSSYNLVSKETKLYKEFKRWYNENKNVTGESI
jgi:hypothetical protein